MYHSKFILNYYSTTLCGVGALVGACCGVTNLNIYCINDKLKIKNTTGGFNLIINPSASYSFNFLTNGITGAVIGYVGTAYYPITIAGILICNLLTIDKSNSACGRCRG